MARSVRFCSSVGPVGVAGGAYIGAAGAAVRGAERTSADIAGRMGRDGDGARGGVMSGAVADCRGAVGAAGSWISARGAACFAAGFLVRIMRSRRIASAGRISMYSTTRHISIAAVNDI